MVWGLTPRDLPAACVAVPPVALAVVSAGLLALTALSGHPLWPSHALNMSEAAALRDSATVLQLIRQGENLHERRRVRAGFLVDRDVALTPLEAAIAARRSEVVDVILWASHGVDWSTWKGARCLADTVADRDVERVLDLYRPVDTDVVNVDCTGVRRPWTVIVDTPRRK